MSHIYRSQSRPAGMPPFLDREQTRERSAAVPHYLYEVGGGGGGGERLPPPGLPFMFTSVQVRRRGGAGGAREKPKPHGVMLSSSVSRPQRSDH